LRQLPDDARHPRRGIVIDGIEEHIPNRRRDNVVARQLLQPHPIGLQIDEIPLLVLLLGYGVEFDEPA
jgi:hypothetical protein